MRTELPWSFRENTGSILCVQKHGVSTTCAAGWFNALCHCLEIPNNFFFKKEFLYFHLALNPAYDELVERNDFDAILWGGSNQLLIQAHMILCLIWRAV